MKNRIRQRARIGLFTSLIFVLMTMLYFAAVNSSPLPYHPAVDGWNDLILHVGAFVLLTVIALMIWPLSRLLVVALFLVGCLMELIQFFVPGREVDAMDVAANSIGVLIGWLAVTAARGLIRRSVGQSGGFKE